jgi:alpha-galactosidase
MHAFRGCQPVQQIGGYSATAKAQSAELAGTPPMGWNSWNHFAEKVTDADVRAAADAMVASGMKDAGYIRVNVDDSWEDQRHTQATSIPTADSR